MDLDLLQKFKEDRKFYELDEAIIDSLETMHVKQAMYILLCLEKMIPYFVKQSARHHKFHQNIYNQLPLQTGVLQWVYYVEWIYTMIFQKDKMSTIP